MKANYTDITIVLDRSGSMQNIKDDTIGGFNAFLQEQQAVPGQATLTLVQFDHEYEVIYQAVTLAEVKPLDGRSFIPRGNTALLDAMGRTINSLGERLAAMAESERPEKVIFVVLTDGQENSSQEFNVKQVKYLIEHQRENYAWEFVFLAANQDAIITAKAMGIAQGNALTYAANSAGTSAALSSLSSNMTNYRCGLTRGVSFSDLDRAEQTKAGV